MRRISAILLLVAFSLPLFAAALQDADSSLPACCRRAGIHHCGGMGYGESSPTNGTALKSGACTSFPTTAGVAVFMRNALPRTSGVVPAPALQQIALATGARTRINTSPDDSRHTRGPPSLLS